MGLYMAEDLASNVGTTDAGMGTESGSPNADTTETTAYGIQAIKKPAQMSMATWERIENDQSKGCHHFYEQIYLFSFCSRFNFPMFTISLQCLTYFCQFDLKAVVVFDAGIIVWNFLRRRLDLADDHDIGENNDPSRENETEEQHGHDEALTRHRGLCEPPVQRAGGSERLRGIIPPANQGHSGPKHCIHPNKGQALYGVMAF